MWSRECRSSLGLFYSNETSGAGERSCSRREKQLLTQRAIRAVTDRTTELTLLVYSYLFMSSLFAPSANVGQLHLLMLD